MKKLLLTTTCLLAAPLAAHAGALEKSGQPVTLLFEKGDIVQVNLGHAMPSVTGVDSLGAGSGNATKDFLQYGGGIRKDFNDTWSVALIVDEPYGANLFYTPETLAFGGTSADIKSVEITGLARYKFNGRFSLHGGLRAARFGGTVTSEGAAYGPLSGYRFDGDDDWDLGYVIGGAFEIPEKALRIALTYSSGHDFRLNSTETFPASVGGMVVDDTTTVTMPQSVNLDAQIGIAPKTLLTGSVRWTNYSDWRVIAPGLDAVAGVPLVDKDYNIWNYTLGVGRQFNDRWSGAVRVTYEPSVDKTLGALSPTDGSIGLGVSARYTMESGANLGFGIDYRWLGDSEIAGPNATAAFKNNHAVGMGMQLTMPF